MHGRVGRIGLCIPPFVCSSLVMMMIHSLEVQPGKVGNSTLRVQCRQNGPISSSLGR